MWIISQSCEGDNSMNPIQKLRGSLERAPVIWKGDYPYFIHSITDGVPRLEPEVLQAVIDLVVERVDWQKIDAIVGIEAMGLPICAPLALAVNKPLIIVRKRSYGLEGEVKIDQSTGYSKGEMYINDIKDGERVFIMEDVISTGGTMRAVLKGLANTKATASVVMTVVEKGEGMAQLKSEFSNTNFESLVALHMDGAKVVIHD
jgi:adenine phosphoribosyltransferase